MNIIKNKKGFSLVEIVAAIVIMGLASTFLTTMVITSYRGQLRAQQYLLAQEMAKNFDSILSKDIKKSNIANMYKADSHAFDPDNDNIDKFKVVNGTFLNDMTKENADYDSDIYKLLYTTNNLKLNGITYNSSNVSIRIYMISASLCYYKTEVTITYADSGRTVTYNGMHFSE